MTTAAIIQARMGSTRLPGKVLLDLSGRPILQWVVNAARAIPGVDSVIVATSSATADDAINEWCRANGTACLRGSENDVLDRFYEAANSVGADIVLRLTADCPLLDPSVAGAVLQLLKLTGADYASNCDPATWPDGLDCEAMTFSTLETAHKHALLSSQREHVTPYIRNNRERFRVEALVCPLPNVHHERWTVDDNSDLAFIRGVTSHIDPSQSPSYVSILALLASHPELYALRSSAQRNEGYAASLAKESFDLGFSFERSQALLRRGLSSIPLASQTFSKSHIQYPNGHAPLFLTHGNGATVWDVDGNEYIDLVCALLPVVLGYRDQDVDSAIRNQLSNGISLSLPSPLEVELAELLIEVIPCAELVRFGKNGTDATSAAIRLARAWTGRDRVLACGYHGWQDWYIGATTRNKGVPAAIGELTTIVPYNDLNAIRNELVRHPGEIAALILEPMNVTEPFPGYLEELKALLHQHGALLVFDEVITGFRYALGGAQQLFNVKPDLACFGKAMGNGMPISAVVGRADVMREMEEIFFSGTFGGEALSLAAAIAVIKKMRSQPVIETLWQTGETLKAALNPLLAKHGLSDVISILGKAPWQVVSVGNSPLARKEAIKTLLQKELLARGILFLAGHNICYSLTPDNVKRIVSAYNKALGIVAAELQTGKLEERLGFPPVEPVFRVRG